jgi:hypothetical protein
MTQQHQRDPRRAERLRRRLWVVLPLVAAALVLWLVPLAPQWIEREYATSRYLAWQRIVTPIGNRVPVALFDLLLIASVIILGAIVFRVVRAVRSARGGVLAALGAAALDVLVIASVLAIWFSLAWGANYRREPLRERLDFDRARVTRDAAAAMAQRSVQEMNRLHPIVHARAWPSSGMLPSTMGGAFAEVQRALGQRRVAEPGRPKRTLLQPYFRWAAIDGMTDPFFLETLVNADVLPVERPFVVAHEWSHLAGYAHEAEANFLGWVICQRGDAQAQYSGWLSLYWHMAASLPVEERRAIDAALQPGPRRDLQAVIERYRRSAPRVRVVAWQVYDRFLKANRVTEGVASYNGVVTLVLGTRFSEDWIPQARR